MKASTLGLVCAASLLALWPTFPAAAEEGFSVTSGEVTVVCPLTIGGSFEASTKALTGEVREDLQRPGSISGALRVDLSTLQTGIGLRDRHMRTNYLEVNKGPDFAVAIAENLKVDRMEGKAGFSATLTLHGRQKEITGTAAMQRRNGRIRVQAEFPLRVSDFEIAPATYLGVGVREELQVKVIFTVLTDLTVTSLR